VFHSLAPALMRDPPPSIAGRRPALSHRSPERASLLIHAFLLWMGKDATPCSPAEAGDTVE
jgi:hypothetical protein